MDSKHTQRNSILLQKRDSWALCVFCWYLTHFIIISGCDAGGAGCVHGSRVLKAEMWRWEGRRSVNESHPLPTLESDLLCAPWSTGRPKAYISHDAEQLRGKGAQPFIHSRPTRNAVFQMGNITSSVAGRGREGGRLRLTRNNHVQLRNMSTRCRWFLLSLFLSFLFYGNAPDLRSISLVDSAANGVTLTKLVGILRFWKTRPDSNPDDNDDDDDDPPPLWHYLRSNPQIFFQLQFFLPFLRFLLNFDRLAKMVRDLMLEASFYFPH